MIKRILFLVLTLLCIISLLPSVSATVATEGTCGPQASWRFDSASGTLIISGSGKMDIGEHAPWSDLRDEIKSITVSDGITTLCRNAFSGLSEVETVNLPSSVHTIGENAFYNCRKLKSIDLDKITTIDTYAFFGCSSLKTVTIPGQVSTIGYGAFLDCMGLTNVTISNGVQTIETDAFHGCWAIKEIIIPDTVTTIDSGAFNDCRSLESIKLSSNLTKISSNLLQGCQSLKKIHIPDKVTSIGKYAFYNCSELTEAVIGAGVSEIGVTAFRGCTQLKAFTLSPDNRSFYADRGVLYNASKTELKLMPGGFTGRYTVLSGAKTFGAYSAYGCVKLTELTIPGSVAIIDDYALDECASLKKVTLSEGLTTIGLYAFSRCVTLPEITIPSTVTSIEGLAFSYCSAMKTIIFRGNAMYIGDSAFSGVTATAYYPKNSVGWTKNELFYGGRMTWQVISCNGMHTEVADPAVPPSCTDTGLTAGSHCLVCSEVLEAQKPVPANGHIFSDWIVQIPATEHSDGLSMRHCFNCSKTEQKALPKLTIEETLPPQTKPEETLNTEPEQTQPTDSIEEEIPLATTEATVPETSAENAPPTSNNASDTPWIIIVVVASIVLGGGGAAATILIHRRKE